jgi:hypothetical protein
MSGASSHERRRFRRIQAPIQVRPAGRVGAAKLLPSVGDIGAGGLRAYSDDEQPVGTRIEIDLLFPQGEPARVLAEVAWVQPLPAGSAARFDVGLRFIRIRSEDLARIAAAEER